MTTARNTYLFALVSFGGFLSVVSLVGVSYLTSCVDSREYYKNIEIIYVKEIINDNLTMRPCLQRYIQNLPVSNTSRLQQS